MTSFIKSATPIMRMSPYTAGIHVRVLEMICCSTHGVASVYQQQSGYIHTMMDTGTRWISG